MQRRATSHLAVGGFYNSNWREPDACINHPYSCLFIARVQCGIYQLRVEREAWHTSHRRQHGRRSEWGEQGLARCSSKAGKFCLHWCWCSPFMDNSSVCAECRLLPAGHLTVTECCPKPRISTVSVPHSNQKDSTLPGYGAERCRADIRGVEMREEKETERESKNEYEKSFS